jgi:hypothetical protein
VVPPRRPAELAQACLTLLTDHERRRALGKAARERALELFTIGRAVDIFDEIYNSLAAPRVPEPELGCVTAPDAASGSTESSWAAEESSVPSGLAA